MSNDLSSWNPCEAEELQSLGRDLRKKGRDEATSLAVRRLLGTAAVVALLAFSISTIYGTMTPGGITCSECYAGFDSYANHLEGSQLLPHDQAEAIRLHLVGCSYCENKFIEMYPGIWPAAAHTASFGLVSLFLLSAWRGRTKPQS